MSSLAYHWIIPIVQHELRQIFAQTERISPRISFDLEKEIEFLPLRHIKLLALLQQNEEKGLLIVNEISIAILHSLREIAMTSSFIQCAPTQLYFDIIWVNLKVQNDIRLNSGFRKCLAQHIEIELPEKPNYKAHELELLTSMQYCVGKVNKWHFFTDASVIESVKKYLYEDIRLFILKIVETQSILANRINMEETAEIITKTSDIYVQLYLILEKTAEIMNDIDKPNDRAITLSSYLNLLGQNIFKYLSVVWDDKALMALVEYRITLFRHPELTEALIKQKALKNNLETIGKNLLFFAFLVKQIIETENAIITSKNNKRLLETSTKENHPPKKHKVLPEENLSDMSLAFSGIHLGEEKNHNTTLVFDWKNQSRGKKNSVEIDDGRLENSFRKKSLS